MRDIPITESSCLPRALSLAGVFFGVDALEEEACGTGDGLVLEPLVEGLLMLLLAAALPPSDD